ncbi:hypothetical protein NUW54_g12214 [Trametes sanguinea]|uniref:Uncharacterized protein n=1 Tax=Trametes sanguinea TaxID=158606 RepID=A0ACC1N087_9APHY|nr:hypothetical protein NUW54_g12214 [Trametes sanguinea]
MPISTHARSPASWAARALQEELEFVAVPLYDEPARAEQDDGSGSPMQESVQYYWYQQPIEDREQDGRREVDWEGYAADQGWKPELGGGSHGKAQGAWLRHLQIQSYNLQLRHQFLDAGLKQAKPNLAPAITHFNMFDIPDGLVESWDWLRRGETGGTVMISVWCTTATTIRKRHRRRSGGL